MYSPIMLDLMAQTLRFEQVMDAVRCPVPTRIVFASDDDVAGSGDHLWFARRADPAQVHEMTGGHLCVVADPARVAARFANGEVRSCI